MSHATHHQTAAEDRIPFHQKLIYGAGAFVNNILAAAMGGMVIVLNLGLGMNPALVGLLGALPRITDAITDPLMGYISDNTESRYGRRRPYIFVGAISVAIVFALLWQLPIGKSEAFYFWYFLAGSIIFYLAYTVFATPLGCARLRTDARLPRENAPDGRAKFHWPACLHHRTVFLVDNAEQDAV